jgi:hypothetical protein
MILYATFNLSVSYRIYFKLWAFLSVFSDIPLESAIYVLFGTYFTMHHLFT